jgi:ribosome biogenesis protein SLX9
LPTQTKKEKKHLKHELFLQREHYPFILPFHRLSKLAPRFEGLTSGTTPYSKSHNRRLKRKAKSELSTDFASVEKALLTLAPMASPSEPEPHDQPSSRPVKPAGLMGEGKGVTLSKKQRRKAL